MPASYKTSYILTGAVRRAGLIHDSSVDLESRIYLKLESLRMTGPFPVSGGNIDTAISSRAADRGFWRKAGGFV